MAHAATWTHRIWYAPHSENRCAVLRAAEAPAERCGFVQEVELVKERGDHAGDYLLVWSDGVGGGVKRLGEVEQVMIGWASWSTSLFEPLGSTSSSHES